MASDRDDHRQQFATTHWSVVLAAGQDSSPTSRAALAQLCEVYWYPLYAYVRRQGHDAATSADLTQGFFASLLERQDLRKVQRERGRFRSFLLASIKHFLINEWDRAGAAKRGGRVAHLSIDFSAADSRYRLEPYHERTPEAVFEKQWALTLLARVQEALRSESANAERLEQYDRLQIYLAGERQAATYQEVAEELGMSEGAVKVAVHRMRQRFREILREEIAHTVTSPDEIDGEIQSLFEALRS